MSHNNILSQPCSILNGVGPKVSEKLQRLGIDSVQALLFHLPFRYEDRTRLMPLKKVQPFQQVCIEGRIISNEILFRGRRQLIVQLQDDTGAIHLKFFHFSKAQQQHLKVGRWLRCFGEIRLGYRKQCEIIHPECQFITEANKGKVEAYLTPVYPVTEGLHQLTLRKLMRQAVTLLEQRAKVDELLPESVCQKFKFPSLCEALVYLHRPPPTANVEQLQRREHPYQQRLAFEELLAHHLCLQEKRRGMQQQESYCFKEDHQLVSQFLSQLPFQLTHAQQRVYKEIAEDMFKPHPMLRLVQGDVGSGKTVVAALASLLALGASYQVAVMAPTELLAEQHFSAFSRWLLPLEIDVVWLSGSLKGKKRSAALQAIQSGKRQVVIGTHALFQDAVMFNQLGLVIVDEQHRFGVHQRLSLHEKGRDGNIVPHQLIMTATPIPRTLSMSIYADLDHSIIDELPPGRKPVTTIAIDNRRRADVIKRIQNICQAGRQVYWVCTLIEESEALQCQAAEKSYEALKKQLPNLCVSLVHGRMKATEKEFIMQAFKRGEIDLLVSTTVIEVGVDVPNASLMVIENAERFGLSQLHQLRGRVGRGAAESHCVLLYQSPLGQASRSRIQVMREEQSGFTIAEKDLELRGPGEVLGTRQTGMIQMRVADLIRDKCWIAQMSTVSQHIYNKNPALVPALIKRWIYEEGRYLGV